MKNFAIFISGRGSNMAVLLSLALKGKLLAKPVVVLSNRRKAPGLEKAKEYGVPTYYIPWKNRKEAENQALKICQKHQVDFLVLAGFLKILKHSLLKAYPFQILNTHPSLLPSFPGLNAPSQALAYGVRFSGCTTHFVTEEVDQGPIILQQVVPVFPKDTPETLAKRILHWEHKLLPTTVNLFAADALTLKGRQVQIQWEKLPKSYCFFTPPRADSTW